MFIYISSSEKENEGKCSGSSTNLLLAIGEPDYNSLETKGVGVEVGG